MEALLFKSIHLSLEIGQGKKKHQTMFGAK